mmetsp:Transcript_41115/g.133274  ORF Transcript_41115/g.133274 Transcript_41115/m.133274 type:complete len:466 (-) Transcript_41115:53-1450(-)
MCVSPTQACSGPPPPSTEVCSECLPSHVRGVSHCRFWRSLHRSRHLHGCSASPMSSAAGRSDPMQHTRAASAPPTAPTAYATQQRARRVSRADSCFRTSVCLATASLSDDGGQAAQQGRLPLPRVLPLGEKVVDRREAPAQLGDGARAAALQLPPHAQVEYLGDLLQVGADDDGGGLEGGAGGPRVLRAHRSGAKSAEDAPIGGGILVVLKEGDQLEPDEEAADDDGRVAPPHVRLKVLRPQKPHVLHWRGRADAELLHAPPGSGQVGDDQVRDHANLKGEDVEPRQEGMLPVESRNGHRHVNHIACHERAKGAEARLGVRVDPAGREGKCYHQKLRRDQRPRRHHAAPDLRACHRCFLHADRRRCLRRGDRADREPWRHRLLLDRHPLDHRRLVHKERHLRVLVKYWSLVPQVVYRRPIHVLGKVDAVGIQELELLCGAALVSVRCHTRRVVAQASGCGDGSQG